MKRKSILVVVIALAVFFLSLPEAQADLWFNDGGIHTVDYEINDGVWLDGHNSNKDEPTTVNLVTGGDIGNLNTLTGGLLNVYGGSIGLLSNLSNGSEVNVYDGYINHLHSEYITVINVFGGSIRTLCVLLGGPTNIYGGSIGSMRIDTGDYVTISGGLISGDIPIKYGQLNILDGYIEGGIYSGSDGMGNINISGGYTGGDILLENSQLTVSGGMIDGDISVHLGTTANLSGGLIGGSLIAGMASKITINGTGFNYPYGNLTGSGILTGTLANGDFLNCSFNIFSDIEYPGSNGEIVLVPIPGALLLGVIGIAVSGWRLRKKME